jgi:alpha-beta hydrolase superfamily lysophospholipase
LVFYLHGNKGNVTLCRWEIEPFIKAGFDVCMMDYRGFGKSKGDLSEFALLSDAQLVYERIRQTYDENAIVVWGRSFGSGIAAYVASVNCPRGVVLESPYYSIPDCVAHRYPYVPSFLLRYRLRTCDYLGRVRCPVCLVHGTADEKIYFGSSLKLRKLMDTRGRTSHLESVPDGTHNLREHPRFHVEGILSRISTPSAFECGATVQPPDSLVRGPPNRTISPLELRANILADCSLHCRLLFQRNSTIGKPRRGHGSSRWN